MRLYARPWRWQRPPRRRSPEQAKRLQVQYGPLDDSPARVEAAISRYQETMSLDRKTESGRRTYARMLMEQAEALLHYGQFDLRKSWPSVLPNSR